MPETLTAETTIDLQDLPEFEPAPQRMSCESTSLFIKVVGTAGLMSTTLGATGDLATALFVGVGYATTLVCVAVLPVDKIPTRRLYVKSQTKHQ